MRPLIALALLIGACGQHDIPPAANQATDAKAPAPRPSAPAVKPFSVEIKNDLMEFEFSWPAEAAAIPELDQRFRAELEKARAELLGSAEDDKARRDKEGMDYNPFLSSTVYRTEGQSARLLSLKAEFAGYEGGAHGNYGVGALLWDRRARREMTFADLFADRANRDRLLTQRWCDALRKAQEEKRGEPVGGGGMFDECPGLDDIAIIPVDSNKDGHFNRLLLVASPYVAGPWVEGAYEIDLAVTPDLIAGLKAEFRPSFKA